MALSAKTKNDTQRAGLRAKTLPARRLIGWETPILPNVVEQLLAQHGQEAVWDLREILIVLPGGLATRRLGELLALAAKRHSKILYPPQMVTIGALPERLYIAKYPFASDIVQQLTWMHALQSVPAKELSHVVPVLPHKAASQQWLELAKIFSNVHRELATEGLDFERVADVLGNHPETPRWRAMSKIQARYLAKLDALELWDIQTARLCALKFNEPSTSQKIIVVACADLNSVQRGFIEQIAAHVEVWIAAPESASARFDNFGVLIAEVWQNDEVELGQGSLLVGSSPSDQAELTCASLAELADRYHVRDVTIGVPDAALISELKQQLDQCGITARYGPGTPLAQSEPALLLGLIGEYVGTKTFAAFAALVRHPAIEPLLRARRVDLPEPWLALIDEYYQAALPRFVDGFVNSQAKGAEVYLALTMEINRWLEKLTDQARPLSKWVGSVLEVMSAAYGDQLCDLNEPRESSLYQAASQVCQAIVSLGDIPSDLDPRLNVSELIDWLQRSIATLLVPAPAAETAVEMMGWLELALDDASALILTGIHDGVLPESANADAFLPNGLRRHLGMMDNSRRFARDMYLLQVLLRSKQYVRIVVGKSDAEGNPLLPSRLLTACALAELPERVLHLVKQEEVDVLPPVTKRWKKAGGSSQLAIPQPTCTTPPRHMTVTAFRDYLACPYRFYLTHVLKLRESHDAEVELNAPMFGNLLHDTLQLLGEADIARSTDADAIRQFLSEKLQQVAIQRFGPNPPSAVLIQIEQAEQRLDIFAPKQAERAQQGWEIHFTEKGVNFDDHVLLGKDKQLHLIGRIDRIDYHPKTDQWAIWDYKTSDTAKHPLGVHWSKQDGWKDLQLPLYRPVAAKLGVGKNPSLGYIALPKQAADVGFHVAEFTSEQLREADEIAAEVASKVAACEFWPDELGSPKYDNFPRICQSNVQFVAVDPPRRWLSRHEPHATQLPPDTVRQAKQLLANPVLAEPKFPPLLIRASAGTGKTFQLTNRLLQIVLSGQEVDSILAITFTRKAAGEILHRVLQRLAQGCIDPKAQAELEQHLPEVDASAAACLAALRRVTRSLHRLRVGTLDSFFAQVARAFSLELGLSPGWNSMDPIQEPIFQSQAIGQMLDNQDRETLVDLVRMLAKGDSARQISDQIRQTVASGYSVYRATESEAWDQLPLPTPPSEAAVESALLTLEQTQLNHRSAQAQMLKLHLDASSGNWESVVAHGIFAKIDSDPPSYYGRELDGSLVAALRLLIDRAAAELLPIRRNQTLASYKVLDAYNSEYSSLIRRRRSLAFSDVSYFLAKRMNSITTGSAATNGTLQMQFRLDCGVQHLLLDEFQDTAPEQWQILLPLARPLGGEPVSQRSFFCVGDTKQAIYGWRGGVAEIFDSVGASIDQLQQTQMSDSYRSSPEVIRAVNQVFTQLPQHNKFSGCDALAQRWSRDFPEHHTSRTKLTGYVQLQNGPKFETGLSSEDRKEGFLKFTADKIATLSKKSSASIGVLFRTNADVGRMISLLRDRDVSASQDGGNPLTDSVAVALLLSLVHLADHPGDGVCAFHVATSPLAAELPGAGTWSATQLAHWFRTDVARRGLGSAIESIADKLADKLSWWDQHRLQQLVRMAYEYQPSYSGRLRDFEEAVTRARVALPTESQVKVMTIHKSKGLEFDAVFLPELDVDLSSSNGLFVLRGDDPCMPPSGVLRYMSSNLQTLLPMDWQQAFEMYKQRGITESLCMLYVAMTRAKRALYMATRPTSSVLQDMGSLLQSTLGANSEKSNPEAILYADGNPLWFEELARPTPPTADRTTSQGSSQRGDTAVNAATDAPKIAEQSVALRTDTESAPARGLRMAAPSSIGRSYEPIRLSTAFSQSHSVQATLGTLMHAFFQQVHWLDDYQVDRERLRQAALATIEPEALRHLSLLPAIEEFEGYLRNPNCRRALVRSRYDSSVLGFKPERVEIDCERPISIVMGNQLVTGTIDRLAVLMKDGRPYAAEIIDFKTDRFDPHESLLWLDERIAHHRPQLEIYAQVVAQLFNLPRERIATYLLMLSTDALVRCDPQGKK